MKVALFGITGQDGLFANFLLLKHKVHGVVKESAINRYRIDKIEKFKKILNSYYGDVTDALNVLELVK